jgi:hypothetical protein
MDYTRITSIDDPHFKSMHGLMQAVLPSDEVLPVEAWRDRIEDGTLRVYAALHEGRVAGATGYHYYHDFNVAMMDFTIVGEPGLGVGRFLFLHQQRDLRGWAEQFKNVPLGVFAEVYNPHRDKKHASAGTRVMDPVVRREVLSHLGYKRCDIPYVRPSWKNTGEAIGRLDLCCLPTDEALGALPSDLVANFLTRYYAALSNKPAEWRAMVVQLRTRESVPLLPL